MPRKAADEGGDVPKKDESFKQALQAAGTFRDPGSYTADLPMHANTFRQLARTLGPVLGETITTPLLETMGVGNELLDAGRAAARSLGLPIGTPGQVGFDHTDLIANRLGILQGLEDLKIKKGFQHGGRVSPRNQAREAALQSVESEDFDLQREAVIGEFLRQLDEQEAAQRSTTHPGRIDPRTTGTGELTPTMLGTLTGIGVATDPGGFAVDQLIRSKGGTEGQALAGSLAAGMLTPGPAELLLALRGMQAPAGASTREILEMSVFKEMEDRILREAMERGMEGFDPAIAKAQKFALPSSEDIDKFLDEVFPPSGPISQSVEVRGPIKELQTFATEPTSPLKLRRALTDIDGTVIEVGGHKARVKVNSARNIDIELPGGAVTVTPDPKNGMLHTAGIVTIPGGPEGTTKALREAINEVGKTLKLAPTSGAGPASSSVSPSLTAAGQRAALGAEASGNLARKEISPAKVKGVFPRDLTLTTELGELLRVAQTGDAKAMDELVASVGPEKAKKLLKGTQTQTGLVGISTKTKEGMDQLIDNLLGNLFIEGTN